MKSRLKILFIILGLCIVAFGYVAYDNWQTKVGEQERENAYQKEMEEIDKESSSSPDSVVSPLPEETANEVKPKEQENLKNLVYKYNYSGKWTKFVDIALPLNIKKQFRNRLIKGILIIHLMDVLKDVGPLPEKSERVMLDAIVLESGEIEYIYTEAINGVLFNNFTRAITHPGRRLRPKNKLAPNTKGEVEFREENGKISAIAYQPYAAPPTCQYLASAVYIRFSKNGSWIYTYAIGIVFSQSVTIGQIKLQEGHFPKLYLSDKIPDDILGKLENKKVL